MLFIIKKMLSKSNTNSPSHHRRTPELVSKYIQIPDNIDTIDFDACYIDECFILKNIAGYIFKITMNEINYKLDEISLTKFINIVCENYNRNHFHNFKHAVNILQMTFILFKQTNIIKKLEPYIVISSLIAALSHDIDHPGNTNSYEINSMSNLAKLYNDISVLENHHCTLTFKLIEFSGLIYEFKENFRNCRKTIISCILGTDMSKHVEHLHKFNELNLTKENFTIDEQIFIVSSFVHFADLSNPIKNFDISYEWSKRISLEFFEQTKKEEVEGLPTLSFMRVNDEHSMCINEINFITNVSIPSWKIFVSKFENMSFILDNINYTILKWKEIEKKYSDNNIDILNY